MPNWETFLLLLPSTLFTLAMVALVLWPVFVGVLEIFKAVRNPVTQPRNFVISQNGATNWSTPSQRTKSTSLSVGDERLRLSVLLACAIEAAFIVFLTVFLFRHADPHGDGGLGENGRAVRDTEDQQSSEPHSLHSELPN